MTIVFTAPIPGAWLRMDIAAILTALVIGHDEPDYLNALRSVAVALGVQETPGKVARHYGPTCVAVAEVVPTKL